MPGPLQISPETAIALSKKLNVPIEHLMHMPRHILLQKLSELAASDTQGAQEQDQGDAERRPAQSGADASREGGTDGARERGEPS